MSPKARTPFRVSGSAMSSRGSQSSRPRYVPCASSDLTASAMPTSLGQAFISQPNFSLSSNVPCGHSQRVNDVAKWNNAVMDDMSNDDQHQRCGQISQGLPQQNYGLTLLDTATSHNTSQWSTPTVPESLYYQSLSIAPNEYQDGSSEYGSSGASPDSGYAQLANAPCVGMVLPFQQCSNDQYLMDDCTPSTTISFDLSSDNMDFIPQDNDSYGHFTPNMQPNTWDNMSHQSWSMSNPQYTRSGMPNYHPSGSPQQLPSPPESSSSDDYPFSQYTYFGQGTGIDAKGQPFLLGTPGFDGTLGENTYSWPAQQNPYSSEERMPRSAPRPLRSASERKPNQDGQELHHNSIGAKESLESVPPRNHSLYKASASKDGLYRCPYFKEGQCSHKPTKQKCTYDKYLDSHLKPYQCKGETCSDLRFSSNACLFRHEREAHGMHGHGENPHLCRWPSCDRAQPGNGFPRRWNLGDHMKRVHGYDSAKVSSSSSSSSSSSEEHARNAEPMKKRKSSNGSTSVQMKRVTSSQSKPRTTSVSHYQDPQQLADVQQHALYARSQILQRMESIDPSNLDSLDISMANASIRRLEAFSQQIEQLQAHDADNFYHFTPSG